MFGVPPALGRLRLCAPSSVQTRWVKTGTRPRACGFGTCNTLSSALSSPVRFLLNGNESDGPDPCRGGPVCRAPPWSLRPPEVARPPADIHPAPAHPLAGVGAALKQDGNSRESTRAQRQTVWQPARAMRSTTYVAALWRSRFPGEYAVSEDHRGEGQGHAICVNIGSFGTKRLTFGLAGIRFSERVACKMA
jgi:hypothetical protein